MHWSNWLVIWLIVSEIFARLCLRIYEKRNGRPVPKPKRAYLIIWLFWPFFVITYPFWRK